MRSSDWQITWDPAGFSRVLLDYDDLLEGEIRVSGQQLAGNGLSDFALRAVALSRKNRKATLNFSRRLPHATTAAALLECAAVLIAAPWGKKAVLRITPRGGSARDYTSALLSSAHRPAHDDGLIESIHTYSLRIVPL